MLFSRRLDALHEARVRDLKEAHEREVRQLNRLVDALAEQIEYLRLQMHRPNTARMQGLNPAEQPEAIEGLPLHMSEEEEELTALRDEGVLDPRAFEEAMAQAGLRNPALDRIEID